MITLKPLTAENMEDVRIWRNEAMETLRTPFELTEEQQHQYYRDVICNRESHTRYWGLWLDDVVFVGYGGIENIQWENGIGEISLLVSPHRRGQGIGGKAVEMFLDRAFNHIGLECVWGEVYDCGHRSFWERQCEKYRSQKVDVPYRKFYNGRHYGSMMFFFNQKGFV